jgi:TolB-like protein
MSFLKELNRRNVLKIAVAYVVVAWILLQVVNNVVVPLRLPDWTPTLVIVLLGVGFPIALIIAWAFEKTPDGVKRILPATTDPDPAGALAETTAVAASEPASTAPSIAVLPFADMSPDKDQEYFSDGLSEELLNKLARIKGLQVAGRTSSFHFKGKNEDIRTIAEKLGVAHVLEGSVRKSGDKLRITAQLIKAKDGYHLWSQNYDRKFEDIFAIQDEIAEAVATALEVTLGVGQLGRIPGMTRNAEAYDEYLKGSALHMRYEPATYPRAIEHLQRAIVIDPSFAYALIQLGLIYSNGASIVPERSEEWHRKAEEALEQARQIAPESPLVQIASAAKDMNHRRWLAAGDFYHTKLSTLAEQYGAGIQPDFQMGQFLVRVCRIREALPYLERARSADPLNVFLLPYLADAYLETGDTAAGMAEYDRAAGLGGFQLAIRGSAMVAALGTRDRELIDKWLALSLEITPGPFNINATLGALLDDPAAALHEIRRLMSTPPMDRDSLSAIVLAYWAGYYGDPELALTLVRRTFESQDLSLQSFVVWRHVFRDMRRLPGFKDLMRDMGFVDYWKKYGWGDFCRPVGDDDFACE